MRLLSFRNAAAFEAAAGSWLAADERTNNLILSRLHAAHRCDKVESWLVIDGDAPQLAAWGFSRIPYFAPGDSHE